MGPNPNNLVLANLVEIPIAPIVSLILMVIRIKTGITEIENLEPR